MTDSNTVGETAYLDPEICEFRDAINRGYEQRGDISALSLTQRRQLAEEVRAPWSAGGPQMQEVKELSVADPAVRVRVYFPKRERPLPALVYVHGGGWTMFSLNTHDRLMREYAARAGVAVVGVDYSLSPEARYPVAINEIVSVIGWLRDAGASLGIDSEKIVVGGDSAGANLSVAASLQLKSQGLPPCRGMLLNYGVYDLEPRASYTLYDGPDYLLTAEEMGVFWQNYLGDAISAPDALACPLRAELNNLPSAFMAIAECDVLYSENMAMAEGLENAGTPVEARVYRGVTHSFLEAMSMAEVSNRALDDAASWLRRLFAPAPVAESVSEDGV